MLRQARSIRITSVLLQTCFCRAQGGDEWESGKRKQIMALGATECPAARRAAQLTPLEGARAALALTAAPKSMPCREQERAEITRFVEEAVAAGKVLRPSIVDDSYYVVSSCSPIREPRSKQVMFPNLHSQQVYQSQHKYL